MSILEERTSGFTTVDHLEKPLVNKLGGFADVLYNQIVVKPSTLDFGQIIDDKELEVEVWNAHLDQDKELTSIGVGSVFGISYDIVLPVTIPQMHSITFNSIADADKIVQLDDDAIFNFATFEAIPQRVIANRLYIFKPRYNFVTTNNENYRFSTAIHKAYDGTEHRIQNIDNPRMSVSVNYQIKDTERVEIEGWINKALGDIMGLPLYTQNALLTSYAASGSTVLNCDTTKSIIQAGALAIIQSGNTIETIEIKEITDTTITLVNPIENSYGVNSLINVIVKGYIPDGINFTRLTSNISQVAFDFQVEDNDLKHLEKFDNIDLPLYNSMYVLNIMPDRANHRNDFTNEYEIISYNYGPRFVTKKLDFAEDTFQLVYKNFSKEELFKMKSIINAAKGRLNSFYLPTWTNDVTVVSDIGPSDTQIFVKDNSFRYYYADGGTHIRIKMHDGTEYYREILDAVDSINEGQEVLTISSNFGVAINKNDIAWIDFIKKVRFDSDIFQINVLSDSISEINLTMKRVK